MNYNEAIATAARDEAAELARHANDHPHAQAAERRFKRSTHTDDQPDSYEAEERAHQATGREETKRPVYSMPGPTPVIRAPRTPAARKAKDDASHASGHRRAAVAAARQQTAAATPEPQASELDAAVEQLVARYTCGSVIDAAWAASARLHPWKPKGGAA